VAWPGFGDGGGTELRENNFKDDTQKYYEIQFHASDSDNAINLYIFTGWSRMSEFVRL